MLNEDEYLELSEEELKFLGGPPIIKVKIDIGALHKELMESIARLERGELKEDKNDHSRSN